MAQFRYGYTLSHNAFFNVWAENRSNTRMVFVNGFNLNTESKNDLKLLLELAKKLGINTKILSTEEKYDFGLAFAIKKGRTQHYMDTDKFIKRLKK